VDLQIAVLQRRARLVGGICRMQCLERAPGWWAVKRLQKLGWCFLGVQLRGRDFTKPTFAECARVLRKFPNARLFLKLLTTFTDSATAQAAPSPRLNPRRKRRIHSTSPFSERILRSLLNIAKFVSVLPDRQVASHPAATQRGILAFSRPLNQISAFGGRRDEEATRVPPGFSPTQAAS
jgi:hypothetical protein